MEVARREMIYMKRKTLIKVKRYFCTINVVGEQQTLQKKKRKFENQKKNLMKCQRKFATLKGMKCMQE